MTVEGTGENLPCLLALSAIRNKMMQLPNSKAKGFTLIELMIVIAIIAIISAVALPIYNGYIETSREGRLISDINTIQIFQEDYRLRENTYLGGTYTAGAADASLAPLRWDPQTDNITFTVVANAGNSYEVTATDETGFSVCREYPGGNPC